MTIIALTSYITEDCDIPGSPSQVQSLTLLHTGIVNNRFLVNSDIMNYMCKYLFLIADLIYT